MNKLSGDHWGLPLPASYSPPRPLPKEKWRDASEAQRKSWRDEMFVSHPAAKCALEDAWSKVEIARTTGKPQVMLVTGETGSGKTTLAQQMARIVRGEHQRKDDERTIVPVLDVWAPNHCTPYELCVQMLDSLGDPFPRKRPKAEVRKVVGILMDACEVRLVLFDNFQDVPARRASRGIDQLLCILRELIDASKALWVLFGTQDARRVVRSDRQIARRAPYEAHLEYFSVGNDAKSAYYIRILRAIDAWLPLAQPTDLLELKGLIHLATEGIFERLVGLFDIAWRIAVASEREQAQMEDFAKAFDFIHGRTEGINPFKPDFQKRRLIREGEPYEVLHKAS